MNDTEFRCFLDLLMSADPWPTDDRSRRVLLNFAEKEADRRRFAGWIDAYHNFRSPRWTKLLDCIGVDPKKQSTGKCDSIRDE